MCFIIIVPLTLRGDYMILCIYFYYLFFKKLDLYGLTLALFPPEMCCHVM